MVTFIANTKKKIQSSKSEFISKEWKEMCWSAKEGLRDVAPPCCPSWWRYWCRWQARPPVSSWNPTTYSCCREPPLFLQSPSTPSDSNGLDLELPCFHCRIIIFPSMYFMPQDINTEWPKWKSSVNLISKVSEHLSAEPKDGICLWLCMIFF